MIGKSKLKVLIEKKCLRLKTFFRKNLVEVRPGVIDWKSISLVQFIGGNSLNN